MSIAPVRNTGAKRQRRRLHVVETTAVLSPRRCVAPWRPRDDRSVAEFAVASAGDVAPSAI
jgi:hypothetical protein